MREYGYEIRETRKSAYGLKKILIAATAFLCTVGITVTTLVFLTMMSASGSLKKAPEINITSCPEFVTDENVTANIKGIIYDSDSSCTLYINGERVVSTSNAGEKLEWEREYMVFPDAVLQLNIEARDEDGNCISKTKTITRIKTDNTKANETAEYIEKDPWHADTTEIAPYPVYEIGTSLVKNTKDPKSNVRIRKGADINSRQIDTLDAGESVTYLGVCANGWYYIQMNNGEKGYISAEYVKPEKSYEKCYSDNPFYGCQLVKKTKNPNSYVNIRESADTNSSIIAKLEKGKRATFLSDNGNGWYYVENYDGVRGYISAEYVEVQ